MACSIWLGCTNREGYICPIVSMITSCGLLLTTLGHSLFTA